MYNKRDGGARGRSQRRNSKRANKEQAGIV